MKKGIINLIIALVFTSATSFASNITSITTDGTKALIVNTKIWKSGYLNVEIRNEEGNLIFEDTYATTKLKKFNFEQLNRGIYTVTLSDEFKSTKQEFEIQSNELTLNENVITEYKPIVSFEEDFIDLNYLTNGDKVRVSVYDDSGVIFDIDLDKAITINKRFSIDQLPKGSYTFNVSTNNNWYSNTFIR